MNTVKAATPLKLEYKSILNVLPGNFIVLQPNAPDFTIVVVNENYARVTHTKVDAITGKNLFEVFPETDAVLKAHGANNIRASLQFVMDHKKQHVLPVQRYDVVNSETGRFEEHYWRLTSYPVLDDEKNLQYIVHAAENVTDAILLEKKEQRAREQAEYERQVYYNLFTQAPVAICVIKDYNKLIIEFANEPMLMVWGKTKDVLNKPLLEALPEVKDQQIEALMQNVLTTGKPFFAREHYIVLERNNIMEDCYFDFVYAPLQELDGTRNRLIAIATEVTDKVMARKAIENNAHELEAKVQERTFDLLQANQKLKEINNQLEEFTYVASHDLQEPLRKIITFVDFLNTREKNNLSDSGKATFNKISNAAERMKQLINDLFILSKASNYDESFENINLDIILNQVKEDIALEISKNNAIIKASNLGSAYVIPTQISQLFQNLITNSIKYCGTEHFPEITITREEVEGSEISGLWANEKYIKLNFKDNGIGFDPEYSEKIFQLFQRLHGKSEYPGTGIGLSICKKIAENHKGLIVADSLPGKGSNFTVYLQKRL